MRRCLSNSTEDFQLKNQAKRVCKVNASTSREDDLALGAELINCMKKLEIATDAKTKLRIRAEILKNIRNLVHLRYDGVLKKYALSETGFDDHLSNLRYTIHCLVVIHRIQALNPDLIKWIMTKLLLSRTDLRIDQRLGKTLQESILILFRLLPKESQNELMFLIIDQLMDLVAGAISELTLQLRNTTQIDPDLYTSIDVSDVNYSKNIVYLSIIELLRHGSLDCSAIGENHLTGLWCSLYEICVKSVSEINEKLLICCFDLMQWLFQNNGWRFWICDFVFDASLSTYSLLITRVIHHGTENINDELRRKVAQFMKIFTDAVFGPDCSSEIYLQDVFQWAEKMVFLVKNLVLQSANCTKEIEILFDILSTMQRMMITSQDLECFQASAAIGFEETSKILIRHYLNLTTSGYSEVYIARLGSMLHYLLRVDQIHQNNKNADWVFDIYSSISRELRVKTNHEGIIILRHSLAASLCFNNMVYKTVLKKFLPEKEMIEQWISVAIKQTMGTTAHFLLSLFRYIAELIDQISEDTGTYLGFLSIPWLNIIDLSMEQHHKRRLPILKTLEPIAKRCRQSIDNRHLSCTLKAICRVHADGWTEWRRQIFEAALLSTDLSIVETALNSFAELVASIPRSIHSGLLLTVIEVIPKNFSSEIDLLFTSNILAAISKAICSMDASTEFNPTAINCKTCMRARTDGTIADDDLEMPAKLTGYLLKIFEETPRKDSETIVHLRKEACGVLWSCLAHGFKVPADLICASLICLQEFDEDVRAEYQAIFKLVVANLIDGPDQTKILEALQNALKSPDLNQADLPPSKIYRNIAPYLYVGAIHALQKKFARFCFIRLLTRWMRLDDDSNEATEVDNYVMKMVQDKAQQEKITVQSLFLRHSREICRELSEELRTFAFTARNRAEENMSLDEATHETEKEVDTLLDNISHVFEFDTKSFLNYAAVHIVSYLLLVCDVGNYHRDDIFLCINRICVGLNKTKAELLVEIWPSVIEKMLEKESLTKTTTERLKRVFMAYANVNIDNAWSTRRYQVVYALLRSLCLGQEKVLGRLRKIISMCNPNINDSSQALTEILRYNCEYLGFLLSFRRHLTDDENYELRENMLDSLLIIIRTLQTDFLDMIAAKILVVLRAATATLGKMCSPVWCEFARSISSRQLTILLPQILIVIEPLFTMDDDSHDVLEALFQKSPCGDGFSDEILHTARVLAWHKVDEPTPLSRYLKRIVIGAKECDVAAVIEDAVKMLYAECDLVGRVVLQRLLSNLDGSILDEASISLLVRALLYTIRNCGEQDVRELAACCLGRIGAVDPGRVGLSLAHRMTHRSSSPQSQIIFVDDPGDKFYLYLLERCWRVYSTIVDAELINHAEFSLQNLLKTLKSQNLDVLRKVENTQCRQDLEPLASTKLNNQSPYSSIQCETPIIENSCNYHDWLLNCFLMGISQVSANPLSEVFRSLIMIASIRDASFLRELLPHLIIQLIIELNEERVEMYTTEIEICLRIATENPGWQRMAANAVCSFDLTIKAFGIIDSLEAYILKRSRSFSSSDKILKLASKTHSKIVTLKNNDGEFLIVAASEKCGCLLRSLRWCEQFAIGNVASEVERHSLYVLERVYMSLGDVDGVQGAFETIRKTATPTADESILACESIGDFSEAMPLYEQCSEKKDLRLLKALLSLNQPKLALTTAEALYQTYSTASNSVRQSIEDVQMEAAWHLRSWEKLGEFIEHFDPCALTRDTSWGASCATILHAYRKGDPNLIENSIESSRKRVIDRLVTMTLEDADAYAQSYKYFTRLHILDEIEEFSTSRTSSLQILSPEDTLRKWQARSEMVVQDATFLEPILRVRRELLMDGSYNPQICQLLLQSSRLARQAGHLQIAWTFLVEAKALDSCDFELGTEEARFLFQKNAAPASISVLNKMLTGPRFNALNDCFNALKVNTADQQIKTLSTKIARKFSKDLRIQFAEIQLLAAEYNLKAGTRGQNDLYTTYNCLRYLDINSEDLYYRIAVFYDALLEKSLESMSKRADTLVKCVLSTYMEVLRNGRSHSLHVMPRMLTIFLDYTEYKHRHMLKTSSAAGKKAMQETIDELCDTMRSAWNNVDSVLFFDSYPQLISRICHPSESVFELLKEIMAGLIMKFPHQCLWQSVAVYRPDNAASQPNSMKAAENVRQEKMNFMRLRLERIHRVFDVVQKINPDLIDLIDQYDYVASLLIEFADKELRPDTYRNLKIQFPHLYNFFQHGEINPKFLSRNYVAEKLGGRSHRTSSTSVNRKVKVEIMIPYTELMMRAVNYSDVTKPVSFSQPCFDGLTQKPNSMSESQSHQEEIFVHSLLDEYQVFASLAKPKKFAMRGYNGKQYDLLAKGGDELRKDARFNDVNRMMNCLMKRNPVARRRQLMVKTYTVVPLASEGGIMEWLPNLETYRRVVLPLCKEKTGREPKIKIDFSIFSKKTDEERCKFIRDVYLPEYPLVLAEWFRRTFGDPCTWHSARLAYARSTAVMSMIGFVMGLGDRHAENILLDKVDGMMVHVDYNVIFNKGESLPIPEVVPFRLTRNMVDGLGPTGIEGAYRKSCEATMSVMKENKETLLTVIATFVHDPLLEFYKAAERAGRQNDGSSKQILQIEANKMTSEAKERYAKESVTNITKRLEGHIVSSKVSSAGSQGSPMIVEGQVDRLIEMATDEILLSRMYLGWAPYL